MEMQLPSQKKTKQDDKTSGGIVQVR
jgi:hypothetical protein